MADGIKCNCAVCRTWQARIAELEQALRGILHEWDAKSITGRRFTEAIEAARKVLEQSRLTVPPSPPAPGKQ